MQESLNSLYFKWLIGLVGGTNLNVYSKLLRYLYYKEFVYTIDHDENRMKDGLDLRHYFAFENGYSDVEVQNTLKNPCSVLEVMIALARRCERDFMRSKDYDDRTDIWFDEMLVSMHLDGMTDSHYQIDEVDPRVNTMLNRTYAKNGDVGLFTIQNPDLDMPKAELWYQMIWYLNEYPEQ